MPDPTAPFTAKDVANGTALSESQVLAVMRWIRERGFRIVAKGGSSSMAPMADVRRNAKSKRAVVEYHLRQGYSHGYVAILHGLPKAQVEAIASNLDPATIRTAPQT